MENREVFAYDYTHTKKMTGIMSDDVELIMVQILSGDEILRIILKDGTIRHFDSCPGGRITGYEDGEYYVRPDQFEKWFKRTDSYDDWEFDEEEEQREWQEQFGVTEDKFDETGWLDEGGDSL